MHLLPFSFPLPLLHCSLVRVPKAIARIPTLAIHLSVGDERTTFKPNLQNHFPPLLATKVDLHFPYLSSTALVHARVPVLFSSSLPTSPFWSSQSGCCCFNTPIVVASSCCLVSPSPPFTRRMHDVDPPFLLSSSGERSAVGQDRCWRHRSSGHRRVRGPPHAAALALGGAG